jgi:hypothetical protein
MEPEPAVIVPKRQRWWLAIIVGTVALFALPIAATVHGQAQVALGQRFLDAVHTGDAATAESLSDGDPRAGVHECLATNAVCMHYLAPLIATIREAKYVDTSSNVTVSWNERCVEAGAHRADGKRIDLYLIVKKLDQGWRVTDLSETRQPGSPCDDS